MHPFHHCTILFISFPWQKQYASSTFFSGWLQRQTKTTEGTVDICIICDTEDYRRAAYLWISLFFNYVARELCTFALYLDISTAMESEKNDWIKSITFWSPLSLQIRPDNKLIRQWSIDLMWCLLVTWDTTCVKLH